MNGYIIFLFEQIKAAEVDFWNNNYDHDSMKLMHDSKMYPPYTSLLAHSTKNQRATVILKIKGTTNPTDYTFRISKQFISSDQDIPNIPASIPAVSSISTEKLNEVVHFNVLYTTLCQSVAHQWKHVSAFLGVNPNAVERIQRENNGDTQDCFREMLKEWLKQSNPLPTKSKILKELRELKYNEEADRLEQELR